VKSQKLKAQGSRLKAQGSRLKAQGSRQKDITFELSTLNLEQDS